MQCANTNIEMIPQDRIIDFDIVMYNIALI